MEAGEYYEACWSESVWGGPREIWPGLATLFEENIRPGWSVLDFGCGDGRTSGLWLKSRGCSYVGVDISGTAVRNANEIGLAAVKIGEGATLPFPEDRFNAAVCVETFEHLFAPEVAAAEILRVLKPGGILIATVPNITYWRRRIELAILGRWNPEGDGESIARPWRDPHIRFFGPAALRDMLTSVGFIAVRVSGHSTVWRDSGVGGRRIFRAIHTSLLYRGAEALLPGLLALRLHAIAVKPK